MEVRKGRAGNQEQALFRDGFRCGLYFGHRLHQKNDLLHLCSRHRILNRFEV